METAAESPPLSTDACIIGAGPVGLFAVFELGLLDMRAHLVDILARPGGQCAELYPEKPIYDIPALSVVSGQELTDRLMSQIAPFHPVFHFQQMAVLLERLPEGSSRHWRVSTDEGTRIDSSVVVIAAGGGSFAPKKPAIADIDAYEGTSVFYSVRGRERFRDRRLVVAGGGDSALDWALDLSDIASRVALLHHRDAFRAMPDSVAKMHAKVAAGAMDLHIARLRGIRGADGRMEAVLVQNGEGNAYEIAADMLLPFYGLTMKPGPVGGFGYAVNEEGLIPVDTEKFETSLPGVFAIGDINWYPGKLKLILSGFHESALMAQAAFRVCFPERRLRFQYTTSSTSLQSKLGVSGRVS